MTQLDLEPFRLLIDRAAEPARHHFRRLFWPLAIPLSLASVVWSLIYGGLLQSVPAAGGAWPSASLIGAWFLATFILLLAYFLGFATLTAAAVDIAMGQPVDMLGAWRRITRPAALLTMLMVGVLGFVSMACCVLPSLYVMPALSFALPVLLVEGLTGSAAIQRSFALANFNPSRRFMDYPWVQASVITLIGWVVVYAITLCAQLPFIVAQQLLLIRQIFDSGHVPDLQSNLAGQAYLQLPANVVGAIATTIGWMYPAFAMVALYIEVRRRREGYDLADAVTDLERRYAPAGPADRA